MSNERDTQREIRKIVRMLEATTRHLEKASILDGLSSGEARCIRQFNNALTRLYELEALPEGLFDPLDEDASAGDIGQAYQQVATYLKEGMGFDFDLDFKKEKETIGNVMKDVGDVVARSIFSIREKDSDDSESDGSATVEVVEIEDDEKPDDPADARLDKLEEQMGTVVEILQELRAKKDKKDKKDDK